MAVVVALRKESVDRNSTALASMRVSITSLSARRAWIEIDTLTDDVSTGGVALRKESVDRNSTALASMRVSITSLSARRAWIEIARPTTKKPNQYRRSPQGERG